MGIFHSGLYLSWNGFLHHQFTEYNTVCSDTHSPLVYMSHCIICILICFPIISHFVCSTTQALKNAVFMTFGHLPYTLVMLVITGLILYLCACSVKTFALVVVISGICGFSVVAFIYSILFDRIFKKYEPESPDNIE